MRYLMMIMSMLLISAPFCMGEEAVTQAAGAEFAALRGGALESAVASPSLDMVAMCAGNEITQEDIDRLIKGSPEHLRDQMKSYQLFALERKAVDILLKAEARRWAAEGNSATEDDRVLVAEYFASAINEPEVTAAEAKQFYEKNKETFHGATFDRMEDAIVRHLRQEKRTEARDRIIQGLARKSDLQVSRAWLESAVKAWEQNPVEIARKSGKPTFIGFSVVGCCDKITPIVQKLQSDLGDAVNAIHINLAREEVVSSLYRVKTSPTLFFYDKTGKEISRYEGELTEEEIKAKLVEIGVN